MGKGELIQTMNSLIKLKINKDVGETNFKNND